MTQKPELPIPPGVWLVIGGMILLAAVLGALLYTLH
jgi:hypothetical protein